MSKRACARVLYGRYYAVGGHTVGKVCGCRTAPEALTTAGCLQGKHPHLRDGCHSANQRPETWDSIQARAIPETTDGQRDHQTHASSMHRPLAPRRPHAGTRRPAHRSIKHNPPPCSLPSPNLSGQRGEPAEGTRTCVGATPPLVPASSPQPPTRARETVRQRGSVWKAHIQTIPPPSPPHSRHGTCAQGGRSRAHPNNLSSAPQAPTCCRSSAARRVQRGAQAPTGRGRSPR